MGSRTASDEQQDVGEGRLRLSSYAPLKSFKNPLPEIWEHSPIKVQDSYFLQSLAVTLSNFDYPAAVFWGFELSLLYNKAWEDAGGVREQGRPQRGSLSPDAWHALQKCINGGKPTRIPSHALLREQQKPEYEDYMVLLSPLFEPNFENAKGVVCQLFYNGGKEARGREDGSRKSGAKDASLAAGQTDETSTMDSCDLANDSTPLDEHPFFHRFAEMIPTGLAILDHNARAVFVNQHFYQLTTHWGEDQSFKSWPQSIHPDDYDRVMNAYQDAFRSQTELRAEFRALGSQHPWRLLLLTPLGTENLRHVSLVEHGGFICSVVDITSEKSAEDDQRRAAEEATERKRQQERFIDMISHEIRNPLSAMVHCVGDINDVLKKHEETGKIDHVAIAESLDTINLCISHQKNIVDDVLSYSKLDSSMLALTPKPCQPESELRGNLKIFQPEFRKHNIDFNCTTDEAYREVGVDWTLADLSRIGQVLINLISNAIKFTSRKDETRSITCKISASKERPTSYPPNLVFFNKEREVPRLDSTQRPEWGEGESLYIMVAVIDTGIGISAENQKKLFERFKQATPKTNEIYGGSGLGLNISRKLVQLHGGEIGVTSDEGKGATFGFFFRVKRSGAPEDGGPSEEKVKRQTSSARGQIRMSGLDAKEESSAQVPDESRRPQTEQELKRTQSSKEREIQSQNLKHDLAKEEATVRQESHERGEVRDEERRQEAKHNDKPRTESQKRKEANQQTGAGGELGVTGQSLRPKERLTPPSNKDLPTFTNTKGKDRASSSPSHAEQETQLPLRTRTNKNDPPHALLVEDNNLNQKIVARKLASKGFIVSSASDGREAVDYVIDSFADPKTAGLGDDTKNQCDVDVVLMDQEMPIMDGNTATKEIRAKELELKREKRVPIVGVSGNAGEECLEEMKRCGVDEYIVKPYNIEDMVKKIESMIDE